MNFHFCNRNPNQTGDFKNYNVDKAKLNQNVSLQNEKYNLK
jgi:hypothetical protein